MTLTLQILSNFYQKRVWTENKNTGNCA